MTLMPRARSLGLTRFAGQPRKPKKKSSKPSGGTASSKCHSPKSQTYASAGRSKRQSYSKSNGYTRRDHRATLSLEILGLFCYAEHGSVVRNGNLGVHWSLGLQSNAVEKRTIR